MKQVKMSADFTYPVSASSDRTLLPPHTFTVSDDIAKQIEDEGRGEIVASDDDDDFDEETAAPITEAKRGRPRKVVAEAAPASGDEPPTGDEPAAGEEAPTA
jgi:hypothetical protein